MGWQRYFSLIRIALVCVSGLLANAALVHTDAASAGMRRALIIANSDYVHTKKLPNPTNDGALIAGKLQELGFKVEFEKNLDARKFSDVIGRFASSLGKDDEALFYYAGHGLQFGGENFLVGIDAELKSEATLQFDTFRLYTVLKLIESRAGTTLLFWDACRNNPLADSLVRAATSDGTRAIGVLRGDGAAPIAAKRGDTLVVFSAEPGKFAMDGQGVNSPFAAALGARIATPSVEVESMLKQVTRDVLDATGQYQQPERLSHLTRDFFFKPGREQVADDEEVGKLRAKIALLEQKGEDKPRQRFRILSASDPALQAATKIATRNAGPTTEAPSSAAKEPTSAPGSTQTQQPDKTGSVAPTSPEIVIAVDSPSAAIVRKLAISPDGRLLALGDDDGMVRIILLESFEVIRSISAHTMRVSDLGFAPDSKTLMTAGRDGKVRYWNVETGANIRDLAAPNAIPYSARMNSSHPDTWALMGDKTGRLIAWDIKRNGAIITNHKFHNGPVYSVDYQPNGEGTYLSGGGDGELKIRLESGKRLSVHAHNGTMFISRYSRSGKFIYTAGADRKVKVWEAAKLSEAATPKYGLEGHLRYVLTADMSQNETMLVSGGADKAIYLWSMQSGDLVGQLSGHTADVEAVAFTPNGKFVVSASEDKTVRVWSVEGGTELVRLFFQKKGSKYAGVTLENQSFGDRDSGLLSVYEDGRATLPEEANRLVPYIGRQIAIVNGE